METEAEKTAAREAAAHQTIIFLPEPTRICSQTIFTVMMTLTAPTSITGIIASTIIIIMTITMAEAAGAAMTAAIAVTGDGTAEVTAAVILAAVAAIPVAAVAGTETGSINNPSACASTQPDGFTFTIYLFDKAPVEQTLVNFRLSHADFFSTAEPAEIPIHSTDISKMPIVIELRSSERQLCSNL